MNAEPQASRNGPVPGGKAEPARAAAAPGLSVYVSVAAVTMILTAVELLLVRAGTPHTREILVVLMLAGFVVGALFYQGLRYEPPVYGGILAVGLFFGLLTFVGLVGLLGLGTLTLP